MIAIFLEAGKKFATIAFTINISFASIMVITKSNIYIIIPSLKNVIIISSNVIFTYIDIFPTSGFNVIYLLFSISISLSFDIFVTIK